jgi:hypothetical protein
MPLRRGCCFCCLWNCSTGFLISQHSPVLWHQELCTGHRSPPSSLPEGWRSYLSPRGLRPPPATAVTVVAVGVPANGLSLDFFFFLFLFLPLL